MKVQFFYPINSLSSLGPHPVNQVYSGEIHIPQEMPKETDVLNEVWRILNVTDYCQKAKIRSSCVGDVYVVYDRHFIVAMAGFFEVTEDEAKKWLSADIEWSNRLMVDQDTFKQLMER